EVVRAETRERRRELATRDEAPLPQLLLALRDEALVDVDADLARVGEVEERREERQARDRVLSPLLEDREGGGDERPAHAEAEEVDFLLLRDAARFLDGGEDAVGDVVVPGEARLVFL